MDRKIGPILLSGLMVGPILGSGIAMLPPLAYKALGHTAIWAWLAIMFLGGLFALIFANLTVLYPGDGGMTNAIDKSFGRRAKLYSSLLMISAVSFGPAALMLTASIYLKELIWFQNIHETIVSILLILLAMMPLLKDTKAMSKVSFFISSITGVVLLISSAYVLFQSEIVIAPIREISIVPFGKTMLLLFWAVIGWEVVGNYSNQVKNIKRTIPIATVLSIAIITTIYAMVSMALQTLPYESSISLVSIIDPLFGGYSELIFAVLVTVLCFSTYMLVVGALSRLVSGLSSEGYFPKILNRKNKSQVPINAVLYFVIVHILILILSYSQIINIEGIVNTANGFFILNAVIGLVSAARLINSMVFKVASVFLSLCLLIILLFNSIHALGALLFVYIIAVLLEKRKLNHVDESAL